MIFVNQPIKYSPVGVRMYTGDFDAYFFNRYRNSEPREHVCHIPREKWPAGVTPIAIKAYTQVQGLERLYTVQAIGLGLTKAKAYCDAQEKLRKKLAKAAKDQKGSITYGAGEVVICFRMGKSNLFGRGPTFKDARDDLVINKINIERLLEPENTMPTGYDPKMDEVPAFTEPKRWWQFWKWFEQVDDGSDKYH